MSTGIAAIVALMTLVIAGMMRMLYTQIMKGLEGKIHLGDATTGLRIEGIYEKLKESETNTKAFYGRWEEKSQRIEDKIAQINADRVAVSEQVKNIMMRLDSIDNQREQIQVRLERGFLQIEGELRALQQLRSDTQHQLSLLTRKIEEQELKRETANIKWEEKFRSFETDLTIIRSTKAEMLALSARVVQLEAATTRALNGNGN